MSQEDGAVAMATGGWLDPAAATLGSRLFSEGELKGGGELAVPVLAAEEAGGECGDIDLARSKAIMEPRLVR